MIAQLDGEEFCARCFAGVGSNEHHQKCVITGHAEDGESAPGCICFVTPESMWTTHYGAVEPGSQLEPNPDCPMHFPASTDSEEQS